MALQNPNINYVDPGTPNSDAASLFLRSMQQAHQIRIQQRAADLQEQQQRDLVAHEHALEAVQQGQLANQTKDAESRRLIADQERRKAITQAELDRQSRVENKLATGDIEGANAVQGAFNKGPITKAKVEDPAIPDELNTVDFQTSRPYQGSATGGAPATAEQIAATVPEQETPADKPALENLAKSKSTGWHGLPIPAFAMARLRMAQPPSPQDNQDVASLMASALQTGRARQVAEAKEDPVRQAAGRELHAAQDAAAKRREELAKSPEYVDAEGNTYAPGRGAEHEATLAQQEAQRLRKMPDDEVYGTDVYNVAANLIESHAVARPKTQDELHFLLNSIIKREQIEQSGENAELNATGRERIARIAAGARTRAGKEPKPRAGSLVEKDAYQVAAQLATQNGYKQEASNNRELGKIHGLISATPNAALDAATAYKYIRLVQGSGVVSNDDFKQGWAKIGSIGIKTEDQFQKAWNGQMGDQKRALVREAVEQIKRGSQSALQGIQNNMLGSIEASSSYSQFAPQIRTAYFGEFNKGIEEGKREAQKAEADAKASADRAKALMGGN